MKAIVVYGCPCSGKSTSVRAVAKDTDVIYDFDALLRAITTIETHTPEEVAARWPVFKLRKALIEACRNEPEIVTLYILTRWPTAKLIVELDGIETTFLLKSATKEECLERLDADETRPDKETWRQIINAWFDEHDGQRFDIDDLKTE